MALFFSAFKQATKDPATYRRVDTSSAAGVAEASRKPNIITDVKMGLGLIPEDSSYRSRTERNKLNQRMGSGQHQKLDYGNDDAQPPSSTTGPASAELLRRIRAAKALEKRKAEGQKVRKKFEKEKGERRIALRKRYMKLLKV